jgi:xanthine dehydrogenase accessory factor
MNSRDLFRQAASALESGQHVALVTVIAATGSTPGKVGYKMLVCAEGRDIAGTVGGGLVEAKMIEEARNLLGRSSSRVFQFRLGETPDDEKGICGGSVELLVEVFDATALPLFQELSAAGTGVLVSIIAPDALPRKIRLADPAPVEGTEFSHEIVTALQEAATTGEFGVRVSTEAMDVFVESLAPAPRVVLFGAGHLSYRIARYAKSVHFRVVVCDDRAQYANRERFPEADDIIVEDFTRVFERVAVDAGSYLVIVTRGHRCDEVVLEQAVKTTARYVGMIGSRHKTAMLREKLEKKGIARELLERVYSPVGVAIGAVTPEEIALSIVCELVKIRRLGDGPGIGHMTLSRCQGEL